LIIAKLRQLRRPEHHLVAYQKRRRDFGVAMLTRVHIEHELPERTLKSRQALL
jgi:hypothetical protein